MTNICFWCGKKIEEKDTIRCLCGRTICDDCDDDGSCDEGDGCPCEFSTMVMGSVLNKFDGCTIFENYFKGKTKKFIIKAFEILIDDLKGSSYRAETVKSTRDYEDD